MFHAVEGNQQRTFKAVVSRVVLGRRKIFCGRALKISVGFEPGWNRSEYLQRIARNEHVNFIGGGSFLFGEDSDGVDALAIVGGNGSIFPVINDALLLDLRKGGVNT